MKKKIIIVTKHFIHLGHEIHILRIILLDLYCKKIVSNEDIIIIDTKDRLFLYDKIFNNIIFFDEYDKMDKSNYEIIDISPYFTTMNHDTILELKKFNYDIATSKYKTNKFIEICQRINYFNINEIKQLFEFPFIDKEKFIIIHHRYDCDINYLIIILESIYKLTTKYKIIIFNNNPNDLKSKLSYNNVFVINNLRLYASLLNLMNCILVIGEWSGGSQLSQYCCHCDILYYYNFYGHTIPYYNNLFNINVTSHDELLSISNNSITMIYDYKICSDCKFFFYDDIYTLCNNITKHLKI